MDTLADLSQKAIEFAEKRTFFASMQNMIRSKNPRSVDVKKMKGHATEQDVEEGHVKKEDKHGNDEADVIANEGAVGAQQQRRDVGRVYQE